MKNPFPLLLVLGIGGYLMTRKSVKQNPAQGDMPTSLDYSDPELHEALAQADDDSDDSDDSEDEGDDE